MADCQECWQSSVTPAVVLHLMLISSKIHSQHCTVCPEKLWPKSLYRISVHAAEWTLLLAEMLTFVLEDWVHFELQLGAISVPLVILLQLIDTGAEFTAGRGGPPNWGHWRPDKDNFTLHTNSGFNWAFPKLSVDSLKTSNNLILLHQRGEWLAELKPIWWSSWKGAHRGSQWFNLECNPTPATCHIHTTAWEEGGGEKLARSI